MRFETILILLLSTTLFSGVSCALLRTLAFRRGWLSKANGDRTGPGEIPIVGGLGVLMGGIAGAVVTEGIGRLRGVDGLMMTDSVGSILLLLALIGSYGLLGHLDDRKDLSRRSRFLTESIIALGVIALWPGWAGGEIGLTLPAAWNALLAWLLYSFVIVAGANAFNMCDNSDGLAGATGALTLGGVFVARLVTAGPDLLSWAALAGAGGLLGFLYWNRPPARIYLGDAGTLPLGALIALCLVSLPTFRLWPAVLATPFLAGYLFFDPAMAILGRFTRGRAPWQGGTDHPAHDLRVALGNWTSAWRVIVALQIFSVATGVSVATGFLPLPLLLVPLAPWLALAAAAAAGRRMRDAAPPIAEGRRAEA